VRRITVALCPVHWDRPQSQVLITLRRRRSVIGHFRYQAAVRFAVLLLTIPPTNFFYDAQLA